MLYFILTRFTLLLYIDDIYTHINACRIWFGRVGMWLQWICTHNKIFFVNYGQACFQSAALFRNSQTTNSINLMKKMSIPVVHVLTKLRAKTYKPPWICITQLVLFFGYDFMPWWRHQLETFWRYWSLVRETHRSPVDSPSQRPVTRSFDVFFDLRLTKRLNKQSWRRWFLTLIMTSM